MRLIDADALMDSLIDNLPEGGVLYCIPPGAVDRAPTVDAVPVVRCRDCKFFNTDVDPWCLLVGGLLAPSPDAFCSLGERKEVSGT